MKCSLPGNMRRGDQVDLQKNPKLIWPGDHEHSLQWHHVFQPCKKDTQMKLNILDNINNKTQCTLKYNNNYKPL